MFFYLLYRIGYILSNLLPLRAAYWFAERITDLQYYIVRRDREAVSRNLSIVLKKDLSECHVLARRVFRSFGLYLVDFFRMRRITGSDVEKRVQIVGRENIDGLLEQKRGVIAITGHIGNWEMGAATIAIMGYNIAAVVLNHMYKSINEFFIRQRESKGVKVILMGSSMKRCVSTLHDNGILALAGDRDFTDSGIKLNFFGVPTSIPKGPAVLNLITKAPIVPIFFIRVDRFNYRLIFEEPIEIEETHGLEKDEIIKGTTERFMAVMEKYIREYPEQWLMFRPFWEAPVGAVVL